MKITEKLFGTPKKTAISIICIAALLILIGGGTVFAVNIIARNTSIGEKKAQYLAFEDAGVESVSAEAVHTQFDFEHGTFVYEIEFVADGTAYEYDIKASDGTIIKKETEIVSLAQKHGEDNNKGTVSTGKAEQNAKPQTNEQSPKDNDVQISLDAAKNMALSDAGVSSSEITYTKETLDYEDGIAVYDIEFNTAEYEYEYEINAVTGEIHSKDTEARKAMPDSL
ncbi:MAG: PepSY domain-containing protein [Lachnospiraceae bacterium]|nr:PepSY domain-containing protein [Lachnospiraceae bacterium]